MPTTPPRQARGPAFIALGRAVRETRARRCLSQEALGQRSDLHRNYVGAIERGEINPTLRILRNLADGLDITVSELITLAETREQQPRAKP